MAVDKAIDSTESDSKLTTVADAIRTAGGTTATMSFSTGMVDAISSLASVLGFFAYIWPNIPDWSDTKYKSNIMVFTNTIESFSYTAGNSFTEDGTSFLFENNLLTICFDKFDELYYGEYAFSDIIGTKVLLMGGNVQ